MLGEILADGVELIYEAGEVKMNAQTFLDALVEIAVSEVNTHLVGFVQTTLELAEVSSELDRRKFVSYLDVQLLFLG